MQIRFIDCENGHDVTTVNHVEYLEARGERGEHEYYIETDNGASFVIRDVIVSVVQ